MTGICGDASIGSVVFLVDFVFKYAKHGKIDLLQCAHEQFFVFKCTLKEHKLPPGSGGRPPAPRTTVS